MEQVSHLFYLRCVLSVEKLKEVTLQMKQILALVSKKVSYTTDNGLD